MHSIKKLLSLVSFLLLSYPAISQSVIVNNGDTLICFKDSIVRQIILDLEKGDLCAEEKESYLRDIENLNLAIEGKDSQITNLRDVNYNLTKVVQEKNNQIQKQKDYQAKLRRQRKWNLYKGIFSGTLVGVLVGIVIAI
jgi:hypothetical protein